MVFGLAGTAATASGAGPYDVDVVLPLTGYGAFNGHAQSETLRVIEGYVNRTGGIRGRPLHFAESDSGSLPQTNIQLTSAILAHHPTVVIEGGPATLCRAVAPLYAAGPVMWCLSPAFFAERGSYGFSSGIESRVGMQVTLRYLQRAGFHRIGMLTTTDIAGQEAETALKELLGNPANAGIAVVAWEHFAPGDLSVTAQLAKIKAVQPDIVIGWSTGTPTGTILRGVKDVGLSVPFVTSNANQTYEQMEQYQQFLPPTYLMYSAMWPRYASLGNGPLKDGMAPYFASMNAAGVHIDGSSNLVWDAAMIVVTALRRIGPDATPAQLRDAISTLHDYYGPTGSFDFRLGNQRGVGLGDCIMVRWDARHGRWLQVSAPGGAPLPAALR